MLAFTICHCIIFQYNQIFYSKHISTLYFKVRMNEFSSSQQFVLISYPVFRNVYACMIASVHVAFFHGYHSCRLLGLLYLALGRAHSQCDKPHIRIGMMCFVEGGISRVRKIPCFIPCLTTFYLLFRA
jgi:hypothetical protein